MKHKALFMQEFIYLRERPWKRAQGCRQAVLALPSHSCMTLEERYTQTTSASDLEQGPQS